MNKKMLLLFLMFSSVQVKPIGIVEILVLVGCGVLARTRPAQSFMRHVWTKLAKSQNVALPESNNGQNLAKSDHGAMQRLRALSFQVRKSALQSSRNLAVILAFTKNRVKTMFVGSVKQAETTIRANRFSAPRASSCNGAPADSTQSGACRFTQVNVQQIKSETSGLFPRITNNYYSGKVEEVTEEIGKKRFWQGTCFGGLVTAWLLNPNESKKKKQTKD